jgi:hypothetical protein
MITLVSKLIQTESKQSPNVLSSQTAGKDDENLRKPIAPKSARVIRTYPGQSTFMNTQIIYEQRKFQGRSFWHDDKNG